MTGRPLLVTGSNRSGTTWVGEALCQSGELEYLHEPFNPSLWPRLLDRPPPGHFFCVCDDNAGPWVEPVGRLLRYRFPVGVQGREVRTPKDGAKVARDWARSLRRRARHRRPLLKDPIALFSSEWLAHRFDLDVVVMVRHPAAFASSIKRLGWRFDFRTWLEQPLLLRDHLGPVRPELERMASGTHDLVDEAIVLWNALYGVVTTLEDRHPDWHVLRYEDLAAAPVEGFARLYPALGLRWDEEVAQRVGAFSDETNVKEVPAREKGTVRRDSRAAMWTWTHRLTAEEVDRVRAGTASVAARYYDESAWEPPSPTMASRRGARVASQP
jgi:hypothetical protein